MQYTAFVWNDALKRISIDGGEAENPEALEAELKTRLQPFCQVRKVVESEKYAQVLDQARRQSRSVRPADLYHLF